MKKYLLSSLLLGCLGVAQADNIQTVARTSFTLTNDSQVLITSAGATYSPVYLSGIVIGAASAGGMLTLFNSSWTNTKAVTISSISLGAVGYIQFYDVALTALSYTTMNNSGGVSIIYKKR